MQTYIHIQVKIQCLSNNRWIHWYSMKFVTFLWTLTTATLDTQPDTYLCYWIKYSILTYVVLPGEKEEMSIYRSSADTWVIQWFKCKQSTNIYMCCISYWGNHYTDDQILPIIEMIACMGALCYRITYDAVHLKLLHLFKKYWRMWRNTFGSGLIK